jgi:hypothetical protein
MKPEEKYFVVEGIREDLQWCNREQGFWLCSRGVNSITNESFHKEKGEADAECEKYRTKYREAISCFKEGDEVWFMDDNHICVGIIEELTNIGYNMFYYVSGFDDYFSKEEFFRTKDDLLEHLIENIIKKEV